MSPEELAIDDWFKSEYRKLQAEHGQFRVPADVELELSNEYHQRHNTLIGMRKQEERVSEQKANNERKCEVCLAALPIHRGRPPKRCEEHK